MKHNNMRDDEAQHAYEKKQREMIEKVWMDTWGSLAPIARRTDFTVDKGDRLTIPPTKPLRSVLGGNDHKEEMSLIRALLVFALENVGEKGQSTFDDLMERYDKLREEAPKPDEGVPDSDDYKARYEEAMKLLFQALYIANEFSVENTAAHNIVTELIRKKNELRDSE